MVTKKHINAKRIFSEDFKKAIVSDYEKGKFTVLELSQLYAVQGCVIYRWIYRYSSYHKRSFKVVEMAESSSQKLKEYQKRIADLERIVGQKQLNIDYLEKMIELAKTELGIDIKKNSDTPQSIGSVKTKSL